MCVYVFVCVCAQMNTDGPTSYSSALNLNMLLSQFNAVANSLLARLVRLETPLNKTHWLNPQNPVYYWGFFSTYSQVWL